MFGNNSFGNTSFGSNTFGGNTFGAGFGATPTLGTFGSTTQPASQASGPIGTTIRFAPLSGTDTVQKTGTSGASQITTRHQNISAMKEYETKSTDELRLEDYAANRKVGQPQTAFSSTPFGLFNNNTQNNPTPFGATQVESPFKTNMFANTSKPAGSIFNTSTTPSTSGFLNTSQNNPTSQPQAFGASTSIFGSTPANNTNSFGSTNLFGTQQKTGFELNNGIGSGIFNTMNKPATSTANTSPFGIGTQLNTNTSTSSNQTGFPLFNNNNTQTNATPFGSTQVESPFKTNMFAAAPKPATSIFNASTAPSTSGFLNTNQNNPTSQPQQAFGASTSIFGSTPANNTNSFGSTNLFGTQQKTGFELNNGIGSGIFNTMNKSATSTANTSPFGIGTQLNTNTSTSSNQTGFPLFNNNNTQTNATPFGSTQVESPFKTNMFANASKPAGSIFNTSTTPSTSGFLNSSQSNPSSQPPAFGASTSLFGSTPSSNTNSFGSTNLFGTQQKTGFELNNGVGSSIFNTLNKPASPPTANADLFNRLKVLPYGETSIFMNQPGFTTDPKTILKFKMDAKKSVKLKPAEKARASSVLFDGLDEAGEDLTCAIDVFAPKKSMKKLELKPFISESDISDIRPKTPDHNNSSGIVSTRSDYKIKPSLEELERRYNPEADVCFVDSFLIERPNYGSILFETPLNLKGINLDEVVHIRRKEVVVYPDDENKPPVGQGLNRPAIVTLHQVWPVDKSNNEVIRDVDRLNLMRYPEKIEAATVEKGARFIEYKPETGSWIFAVEHFSRYCIADDDDIDDEVDEDLFVERGNKRPRTAKRSCQVSANVIIPSVRSFGATSRIIKLKPDLFAAQNRLIRDIMSVCVSGAPKVRFFNGSRNFCYIQGFNVMINELKLVPNFEDIRDKFETFLECNSLVTSLNMNPTLAPYIETFDFIDNASSHDLLHALYGNLSTKTPYAKQDERMSRVINWLASINRKIPPPQNLYQLITYHMSCDRYDLASSTAVENGHPRLALLVATLNLDKQLIIEQLTSWRLSQADQYIDIELLKIYILLSGSTEWKLSNDKVVYCLKGLKWTQQLCLLSLHCQSFITETGKYGFHMLPSYIKRLDTNTNDVDYHILARHSPARILSAAETLIEEWFLLESLKSFHVINSEAECSNSDIIHCNLASQLGPIDLRWSCFVALHIINNEVRNQVLIRCLEQNYKQLKEERQSTLIESWLVEKLKIPIEFIENSK